MKKYAIPVVVLLAVLAVTWSAFGQAQDRAAMRERFQNMSPEEQAKFRDLMLRTGLDSVSVRTDEDYVRPLMNLFKRR